MSSTPVPLKIRRVDDAQASSSSLDYGLKLRGLSPSDMRWCSMVHKCDCLECLTRLQFRNNVALKQCYISLTSDRNCFETLLGDFL
ncbi:hypothetical protein TNCV_4161661 [Trichonephila clavipes]|nr:hypothetical protein TNCV_4161661 [Trichonephila clavipes]